MLIFSSATRKVLFLSFVFFLRSAAIAAAGEVLFKILPPDRSWPGQQFGFSLIATEESLLVGAPELGVGNRAGVGGAYLFDQDSGELIQTLNSPVPNARGLFGNSVASDGGEYFTLAPHLDRLNTFGSGTAYVFGFQSEPIGIDHLFDVTFSNLAGVEGGFILADPSRRVDGNSGAGSAYLYERTSNDISIVPHPAPNPGDAFGLGRYSMSGFDNQLVIGSYLSDPNGLVYVIDRESGDVTSRLENPEPSFGDVLELSDEFGSTVATLGTKVIVGATAQEHGEVQNAGRVYVFDGYTGELELIVENPEPNESDEFGRTIVPYGSDFLVAAPLDDVNGIEAAGSVYLFDGKTGNLKITIPNPAPAAFALFGEAIGASEDRIFIGAPNALVDGAEFGLVYAFEGIPEPHTINSLLVGILFFS